MKIFNLRSFVLCFIMAILGIVCAVLGCMNVLFFLLLIPVFCALTIICTIKLPSFKSKRWLTICCAIIFVVGFSSMLIYNTIKVNNKFESGINRICGRIDTVEYDNETGKIIVTLDNIGIDDESHFGKLTIYCSNQSSVELAKYQTIQTMADCECKIDTKSFWGVTRSIDSNIGYGYTDTITVNEEKDCSIIERFQLKVKSTLNKGMNENQSAVAYAMLFGDKTDIDEATIESFRTSGIAHLLAVSGLHVGFLMLIITGILSLCKAGRTTKFIIVSIFLFVYCVLCDFSSSIVRASLMTIVLLFAELRGRQYDGFSSLSFVGLLIVLFNPIALFSASFVLSFMAVFGILCIYPPTKRAIDKVLPEKLSATLAISFSATIGTMPAMIYMFDKFSVYSIMTNLVAIPFASVAFILTFILIPFVMLIPPLAVLLKVPQFVLQLVEYVAKFVSDLPKAEIAMSGEWWFVVLCTIAMWLFSDFFLAKKTYKYSIGLTSLSGCVLYLIIASVI